ncbi:MAG: hypothetical protein D6694_00300 [Gammaproteobacteria bacterium]|nr:MAG: hypothetical protein D6694_00300 [Gammaproteobacteria bacterium]
MSFQNTSFKWRTLIALLLIANAVMMDWNWIWGLLFLYWLVLDLIYQETHLVERVTRDENPVLYWVIIFTWFFLSLFSFFGR